MLKRSPLILSSIHIHTIFLNKTCLLSKIVSLTDKKLNDIYSKNLIIPGAYPVWSIPNYLHVNLLNAPGASEWMCQSVAIIEESLGNSGWIYRKQQKNAIRNPSHNLSPLQYSWTVRAGIWIHQEWPKILDGPYLRRVP